MAAFLETQCLRPKLGLARLLVHRQCEKMTVGAVWRSFIIQYRVSVTNTVSLPLPLPPLTSGESAVLSLGSPRDMRPPVKSQILTYSSLQVTAAPAPQLDSEETLCQNTTHPPIHSPVLHPQKLPEIIPFAFQL